MNSLYAAELLPKKFPTIALVAPSNCITLFAFGLVTSRLNGTASTAGAVVNVADPKRAIAT